MAHVRRKVAAFGIAVLVAAILGGPGVSTAVAQGSEAENHFEVGLTHLREGRVDLAIEEFNKAIKANDKNPYFRKALGHALAGKGKFAEAIVQYRKALELNPYYVDVRNDLGSALVLSGKHEEGKKEFLVAYGDPTNPTPEISAHNMGLALLDEKNYTQAVDWFRTAIGRNKAYGECYILLAEALEALGRGAEALAQLEIGGREAPTNVALRLALGEALFKAGRFGEARSHLEVALKADPSGPLGRKAGDLLRNFPR